MTDPDPLDRLQALVLQSVLTGRPVPGSDSPVRLADLRLATDADGTVRLLDSGLGAPARQVASRADAGTRLVGREEAERETGGELAAVLWIREPEAVEGGARIAVEVCAAHGGALRALDVSLLTFHRGPGGWEADGPPVELAT